MVLGLVGTVTGFILMLGTAFTELDVTNITSVQGALVKMSLGYVYCTLHYSGWFDKFISY